MKLGAIVGVCLLGPVEGDGALESMFDGRVAALEVEPVTPGARGELSVVVLEPVEAGVLLELRLSSDDVALPENRLSWRDVVDPQAAQVRLRGAFVAPAEPGRYAVEGRLAYVSCAGDRCRTKYAVVSWGIEVAP